MISGLDVEREQPQAGTPPERNIACFRAYASVETSSNLVLLKHRYDAPARHIYADKEQKQEIYSLDHADFQL